MFCVQNQHQKPFTFNLVFYKSKIIFLFNFFDYNNFISLPVWCTLRLGFWIYPPCCCLYGGGSTSLQLLCRSGTAEGGIYPSWLVLRLFRFHYCSRSLLRMQHLVLLSLLLPALQQHLPPLPLLPSRLLQLYHKAPEMWGRRAEDAGREKHVTVFLACHHVLSANTIFASTTVTDNVGDYNYVEKKQYNKENKEATRVNLRNVSLMCVWRIEDCGISEATRRGSPHQGCLMSPHCSANQCKRWTAMKQKYTLRHFIGIYFTTNYSVIVGTFQSYGIT